MNLRLAASLTAMALMLSACASKPTIGFESNQEANYSGFKTFAILPLPQQLEGADPGTSLRIATPLNSEIRKGMTEKGYREAPPDQADIVLNIRGKVVGKTDVTDWGYSYAGYGRWGGYYDPYGGISVDQYNEGTLSIEAFNRTTKQLVWVGWARARVEQPDETRFRATVAEVVGRFPPAGKAPAPPAPKK